MENRRYFSFLLCSWIIVTLSAPAQCVGFGRVTIDVTSADGVVLQETRGACVDVFIQLFNDTGSVIGDYESDVNVTCEVTPVEAGYSVASVTSFTFRNPTGAEPLNTSLAVTGVTAGRAVALRCWGESEPPGVDPPQFSRETSLSAPVSLRVSLRGVVSICETSPVVVPNLGPPPALGTGSVLVQLSEPAQGAGVNVTCEQSDDAADLLLLSFAAVVVPPGEQRREVQHSVLRQGASVAVRCGAESLPGGDDQFVLPDSYSEYVQFELDVGTLTLQPDRVVFHTHELQIFAQLDAPVAEEVAEVTFTCVVVVANDTDAALDLVENPTCDVPTGNDTVTTSTTTASPNDTTSGGGAAGGGAWWLTEGSSCAEQDEQTAFVFERDVLYKLLTACRRSLVSEVTQEHVVVTCCGPEADPRQPKYSDLRSAALNTAQLSPPRDYDVNSLLAVGDVIAETELENPAWVEVAPCPCDLVFQSCDLHCCCDPDCSAADTQTFSTCTSGPQGGAPYPVPESFCDAARATTPPDWFPFLCVEDANSGYLGRFFYPQDALSDDATYETTAAGVRGNFSFEETEERGGGADVSDGVYSDGDAVRTALPRDDVTGGFYSGDNFRLTLPSLGMAGGCVWGAPVRFLRDSTTRCVEQLSEGLCSTSSRLNARLYVESTILQDAKCPKSIVVLSEDGAEFPVETNTNYFCAEEFSGHVQNLTTWDEIYTNTTRYVFSYDVMENATCDFDVDGVFVCDVVQNNDSTVFQEPYAAPRCAWDDGYTPADTPTWDAAAGVCSNAVLSVTYNVTWRGTRLVHLQADVVLGNVSINVSDSAGELFPTNLTQTFQVVFHHVAAADNDTEDEEVTTPYARSGNPGYAVGRPVISGVASGNQSENATVDTAPEKTLSLWAPGADGLCLNAARGAVTFGENAVSSCILRLNAADLADCDALRRAVLSAQDRRMRATLVSAGGDPSTNTTDDFRPIYREDLRWLFGGASNDTNATTVETTSFADVTTDASVTDETTPSDVVVTYPGFADDVTGRCVYVPAGVHVDVLYAEAGRHNDEYIYRIVGAKVRYTLTTWELTCSGSDDAACEAPSGGSDVTTQSFVVSSSAAFIRVPVTAPPVKTRYEEEHTWPVCRYEACWRELLYPLLVAPHTGGLGLAVGLTSIFFLLAVFAVTRPWW